MIVNKRQPQTAVKLTVTQQNTENCKSSDLDKHRSHKKQTLSLNGGIKHKLQFPMLAPSLPIKCFQSSGHLLVNQHFFVLDVIWID
jgi:hypothetical protein